MNDVIPVLDLSCTLFLKVAAGVALLTFSRACLLYARRGTTVATVTTTTATSSTASSVDLDKRMDEIVEALQAPAPEPEPEDVIECGNCHKEIRSEPIQQVLTPPSEIYKCEHCGSQVQVQL